MTPVSLPREFLRLPLAHRALHDRSAGRPENSRAAVAAAVAAGYGIELDVQSSADGVAMVFHDASLNRLTAAKGPVRNRDADSLGKVVLKRSGETIPRLSEVLALVAARVPLLIEMKDQSGRYQGSDGVVEAAVADCLATYPGDVAVMSFNPDMVAEIARLAPAIARGLATGAWSLRDAPRLSVARRKHLLAISDFERVGASFISHQHTDLTRARVAELRARGVPVLCWTIRNPAAQARALRHADNVTFEHYLPPIPAA